MANRFLSNIRINDAYTFPASDGTNGQVIKTDGSGNLTFGQLSADSASVMYKDTFTGDGSTSVFSLANALNDEVQSNIYIDGVYQSKSTYSVSGTTLTFSTAPLSGHEIEVISTTGINSGPTAIFTDTFTANGSATAFTLGQTVHSENQTIVFLNGVYQFKGTYTLSGTTLTLDTAPANGVSIEVMSIGSAYSGGDILYDHDFTSAGLMTSNGSGVYSITANNSANWNTAYGWGDHGLSAQDKTDISNLSGTNTGDQDLSSYATQSYVGTQISNLVDSSPATLNTLNELAAALGDDPNFATTTATSIGTKMPLAGGTFTGNVLMGNTVTNPASGFGDQTGIGLKYSTTVPELQVSSDSTAMQLGRTTTGGHGQIMALRYASNTIHSFDTNNVSIGTNATFAGSVDVTSGASYGSGLQVSRTGHPSLSIITGGTSNAYISIAPSGGTYVDAITISDTGNSTFAGMINVNGDGIDIDNDDNLRLRFYNANTFKAGLQVATTAGDMIAGSAVNDFAIRSQENMLFATGGNTERMRIKADGSINIGTRRAALPSTFGYSSGYKTLILGSSGTNYQTDAVTLSLGVDVSGNPSGAYNGSGREIIIRNEGSFISPNAANNGYNTIMSWNSSGQPYFTQNVGIGVTSPGAQLDVVGPSSGSTILKLQRNGVGAYQYFVTDAGSGAQQLFCDAQQADSGFVFRTRDSSNATVTALYVAPEGSIGICNATPDEKLEISGTGSVYPNIKFSFPGVTSRYMKIGMTSAVKYEFEVNGSGTYMVFKTEGVERMQINSTYVKIAQGKQLRMGDYFHIGSGDSSYMGSIGFNRDTSNGTIFNSSYGAYQMHNYQGTLKLQVYSSAGGTIGEHKFYNNGKISFLNSVALGKTTSPTSRLDVLGCVSMGAAIAGNNAAYSASGFSHQDGGSLHMNYSLGGSTSSGDTITFTYAATTWKSWSLKYNFASTSGITSGTVGGYWNNSGGSSNHTEHNNHGVSVAVTHSGQGNTVTFTFTNLGTHPMANFVYMQGGGDGQPRMDRVTLNANS